MLKVLAVFMLGEKKSNFFFLNSVIASLFGEPNDQKQTIFFSGPNQRYLLHQFSSLQGKYRVLAHVNACAWVNVNLYI